MFTDMVVKDRFKPMFDELFNWNNTSHYMVTDVKEVDGVVELTANLAGFNKEDISVTYDEGTLIIQAKKEEEETTNYTLKESFSQTERSFYVGEQYSEDDFDAQFSDGVLKVVFSKKEPKKIEIKQISVK